MAIERIGKQVTSITGKVLKWDIVKGLDGILANKKARSLYDSLDSVQKSLMQDGMLTPPVLRRAFFESRLLEQEFCQNLSKIYGKKIESLGQFRRDDAMFSYLLSGSEINPVTKTIIPTQVRKAIISDCKKLNLIKWLQMSTDYSDYNYYCIRSDGAAPFQTEAAKKFQNVLRKRHISLDNMDDALIDRVLRLINHGEYTEVPGLKLRTSSVEFEPAKKLDNPFLKMIQETSQKTTKVNSILVELSNPYMNESVEAKLLKEQLIQEAKDAKKLVAQQNDLAKVGKKNAVIDVKLNNLVLKNANIPAYSNTQVVSQLKDLKGKPFEIACQSKDIFMQELGYNPEILPIELLDKKIACFWEGGMGFDPILGKIVVNPYMIQSAPLNSVTSLMRHEMDHFELYARLCKSVGMARFKKIILKMNTNAKESDFNVEFWEKAIKQAKRLSPKEVLTYTNAIENYVRPQGRTKISTVISYFGNPIEARAYDISASVAKSLKSNSSGLKDPIVSSLISRRILDMLDSLEKKYGIKIKREKSLQNIFNDEVISNFGDNFSLNVVLNKVLYHLRTMLDS